MNNKPLDPTVVEQLQMLADDEDPDFLLDLFDGYIETTETSLSDLKEAISAEDPVRVMKTAHTLKGASSNIGANSMASLFKQLEELGRAETIDGADEIVITLREEFKNVKEDMKNYR